MVNIGKIGGNEPIKEPKPNGGIQRSEVSQEYWTIFDSLDKNGDQVLNEKDGQGIVSKFWSMITNIGKGEKTQNTKSTGTTEDVNNATNQTTANNTDKFDADGSYKTEVKYVNGQKEITTGGEKVKVGENSLDVTGKNGESIGGTKILPNGMQILRQADGSEGVFDPKKGQFLTDEEAQKILTEMS